MTLERKKTLNVFKDARDAFGSYDDFPVGPAGTDPMPHLSRNRCAQPFFLISERDQVLVHMAGRASLQFVDDLVPLAPGDTVYIPARVPTKIVPDGECVQIRLKVEPAVREAIAWFCEPCGVRVHLIEIEPGPAMQAAYLAGVRAFNAQPRACPACGRVHPPAELGDTAWDAVATAIDTPAR